MNDILKIFFLVLTVAIASVEGANIEDVMMTHFGVQELVSPNRIVEFNENVEYVALYFSGHWCGPCQEYTPLLIDNYDNLNASNIEVVFVSSDRSQHEFYEYYSQMPWFALPWGSREVNAIKRKFGINGIPSMVFINARTGQQVNVDGRRMALEPNAKALLDRASLP